MKNGGELCISHVKKKRYIQSVAQSLLPTKVAGGTLRADTKNGCVADKREWKLFSLGSRLLLRRGVCKTRKAPGTSSGHPSPHGTDPPGIPLITKIRQKNYKTKKPLKHQQWINKHLSYVMHQSIPAAPSPLRADSRALAFFLAWMANSRGGGTLELQMPRSGDEKRGQMPRLPSTLQHFSLIAQSSSAILSILMCDFFVSTNVFLCNDSAILIKTSGRDHSSLWF